MVLIPGVDRADVNIGPQLVEKVVNVTARSHVGNGHARSACNGGDTLPVGVRLRRGPIFSRENGEKSARTPSWTCLRRVLICRVYTFVFFLACGPLSIRGTLMPPCPVGWAADSRPYIGLCGTIFPRNKREDRLSNVSKLKQYIHLSSEMR